MKVLENKKRYGEPNRNSGKTGMFPIVMWKENQIMCIGPSLVLSGVRTTLGKLQKALRRQLLVGREKPVAMGMVKVFQSDTMETYCKFHC